MVVEWVYTSSRTQKNYTFLKPNFFKGERNKKYIENVPGSQTSAYA